MISEETIRAGILERYCQMIHEVRAKIENDLDTYDLILLVENDDRLSFGGLMGKLLNSQAFRKSEKKILVLPAEKYQELVLLYHTYEFSDRFKLIGRSNQHGGLFNYVDNGLLTEQEVFELILR